MLTWELVGAVVGAGMATGREIAAFFAQYGVWSCPGIVLAMLTMIWLANTQINADLHAAWFIRLWKILLQALLVVTGGAMVAGGARVSALTLPIPYAYEIGLAGTLLLAWWLAHRTIGGLSCISRVLLCFLGGMILLGLSLPRQHAIGTEQVSPISALSKSISYGGFNAALMWPIFDAERKRGGGKHTASLRCAGGIILLLLLLGNGVLLRHLALLSEEMPFIRMMSAYGKLGYYTSAACLYLAVLSTLTACVRSLGTRVLPLLIMLVTAILGFTSVVEWLYPLIGGGCMLMLIAAKFMNSSGKPFLSRADMI